MVFQGHNALQFRLGAPLGNPVGTFGPSQLADRTTQRLNVGRSLRGFSVNSRGR